MKKPYKTVIFFLTVWLIASCQNGVSNKAKYSKESLTNQAQKHAYGIKNRSFEFIDRWAKYMASKPNRLAADIREKQEKQKADMTELTQAIFLGDAYFNKSTQKQNTNFHLASTNQNSNDGFIDKFRITILWDDEDHYNNLILRENGTSYLLLSREEGVFRNAQKANFLLNEAYKNIQASKEIGVKAFGKYSCYVKQYTNMEKLYTEFEPIEKIDQDWGTIPAWMIRKGWEED